MMPRSPTAVALLCCLSAPSGAAEAANEFLSRVVGHIDREGSSFACFSRQYDRSHLAAHPNQRVTFAKALVHAYFRSSPLESGAGVYMYRSRWLSVFETVPIL